MAEYYVNKNQQKNGDHEVHVPGCDFFPQPDNRILVGTFDSCAPAIKAARKHYSQVNGCYFCVRECHTG